MKYEVRKNQKKNSFLNEGNTFIKKIEEKIKDQLNNYCVECGEENPEYISINNGIFLCRDCAKNHLKFLKNISKIKKNNIRALTLNEIQYLLNGGNRSLLNFICNEYPKLAELPSNLLYKTHAMIYYRQYLQSIINGYNPPIKPSIKAAYKIPNLFEDISKIEENRTYNITENETLFDNNSNFFRTRDNFIRDEININNHQKLYTNINNDRLTINNNINNTIGNKAINYDNYYINRPKQVNFQNNNNFIIGNKMDFIDNMNINKKKIISSSEKINKNNNRIKEYINTININNGNSEIYIRPKLILSHNVSKSGLIKKNNIFQRDNSYDKIKNYYYSQTNNNPMESKIDYIQLDFTKDININYNNRKLNKNLSHEIYKKTKKYIKSNKYLHKSFSQKIFNNNNYSYTNKNNYGNNYINKNKYTIITQTENNQYIPIKNSTIYYINNNNKICITNNEEFQIIGEKETKDILKNRNNQNNNDKIQNDSLNTSPIKLNIKVNKKDNIHNKENNIKEIKKEDLLNETKIKKETASMSKLEISQKDNIKNFISKCNKNRIILREKKKKNNLNNKINNKEKNINNNKIKKSIIQNGSQDNILKQSNNNQIKSNDNKIEKKNTSIRNRYKGKIKHK